MTTTASPVIPLRARDLHASCHEDRLITIHGWEQHAVTGRFINGCTDFDGDHIARITLELEIDLAPRLFARCLLPLTGDYPVEPAM